MQRLRLLVDGYGNIALLDGRPRVAFPGMTQGETPAPPAPEPEPAKPLPARIPLNIQQQAAAGALGFGALVAGVFAVFSTDNEAGSTALLVVGLLLTVITLAKQVPTSLKAGDNEMAFQAAREAGMEVGAAQMAVTAVAAAAEAEAEEASPAGVAQAVREAVRLRQLFDAHPHWTLMQRFMAIHGQDPALRLAFAWLGAGESVEVAAERSGYGLDHLYVAWERFRVAVAREAGGMFAMPATLEQTRSEARRLFGVPPTVPPDSPPS